MRWTILESKKYDMRQTNLRQSGLRRNYSLPYYISRRLAKGCTAPSLKHLFDLSMSFPTRRDTEAIPPSLVQEFLESVNNERMAQVALATVLLYFTSSGDHFLSYPHINVHCFS